MEKKRMENKMQDSKSWRLLEMLWRILIYYQRKNEGRF